MDSALVLAMAMFSLGMSISPGPVNMVIVASGANHGFWRTAPFVSGATLGFTLLLIFIGFWFLRVIEGHPAFFAYLGAAGAVFIIYIGCKIAWSPPTLALEKGETPTFLQGALLQWLNPKAWIAGAAGTALFSRPQTHATLITFIAIYFVVCYVSLAAWAVLGDRAALMLNSARRVRIFNLAMGGMLIAIACYMLYQQFFAATPSVAN